MVSKQKFLLIIFLVFTQIIIFSIFIIHNINEKDNELSDLRCKISELQVRNEKLNNKINQLQNVLDKRIEFEKNSYEGRLFKMTTTAYTYTGSRCATGSYPRPSHTIAVDPNIIPYGSEVWIEGIGWRVAEDHIGTSVRNNYIDIFMRTKEKALRHGVRELWVFVKN